MDVSLLYFDGCPNHHATLELLEALLDESGWDGTVRLVNVESSERAEELNFRGSPTVLLDSVDPFLDGDAPVGLSCRIYPTADGYRGTPPEPELRAAIARSIGD
jgi:hypothetical protein